MTAKKQEVAAWKQAIATDAKKVAHNEGSDNEALTISRGRLYYQDREVPNGEIDVIVVASSTENCYYDKPYDPDNIHSPSCFAQSLESTGLVPHENVPEPMSAECDDCPMNQFGSAKVGKGKACKNYRKLMMLRANVQAEDVPKAEMVYLKVSPTSIRNWKKYAQQLVASSGLPPWAVRTRIKVVDDRKTIHQILFEGIEPIEDESLLAAIHGRIPKAEERLLTPYTYEDQEEGDSSRY